MFTELQLKILISQSKYYFCDLFRNNDDYGNDSMNIMTLNENKTFTKINNEQGKYKFDEIIENQNLNFKILNRKFGRKNKIFEIFNEESEKRNKIIQKLLQRKIPK